MQLTRECLIDGTFVIVNSALGFVLKSFLKSKCVCVKGNQPLQLNADATYLPTRWRNTPAHPVFSYPEAGSFDQHPKNHLISPGREQSTEHKTSCSVKYMSLVLTCVS